MKRNTITLQFVQNGILLLQQKNILSYKLKSVDNYKVINKEQCINELTDIFNKYKINNNFFTDNINIIIDKTYTNLDIEILNNIFKELSFNKTEYLDLINLFNLNNNELLIDLSINCIKLYYNNQVLLNNVYFSKYKQVLNIYLKTLIKKHNIKVIKLFGNYKFTNKLLDEIEHLYKVKTYFYAYPSVMPIRLLT